MKILELCLSPSLGGLELYMLRTVRALSQSDDVLSVIHDAGQLKNYFKKEALPFLTERVSFRALPILAAKRLADLIDAHNIDVLHLHWGKDLPLAAFAKAFSRKKPRLVYTRQMKLTRDKDDFYHNFLYRQMNRMLVITDQLAVEARRYLSPVNAAKIVRLYYGVDAPSQFLGTSKRQEIRTALGIAPESFLVGLFGRIEEKKGQHLLIEALNHARMDALKIKGLIVGQAMNEAYLKRLKDHVNQQGLSKTIIFKGFVNNVQEWMQVCDCVVLATNEETFGLVLVEAMHAGVAVVGSDSGGVPEIIDDGKTGLLFPAGDGKALYRSLAKLKENPVLKKAIALAGKEKAQQQFSSKAHFENLRDHLKPEFCKKQ